MAVRPATPKVVVASAGEATIAAVTAAMFVAIPGISLVISKKSFPFYPISSNKTSCVPI